MVNIKIVSYEVDNEYEECPLDCQGISSSDISELGKQIRKNIDLNEAFRSKSKELAAKNIMR